MRSSLKFLLILTMLSLAVSCGSDSTPSEPQNTGTSNLSCDNPSLASPSAQPFDHVVVTGISGIDDAAWVQYQTPSGASGVAPVILGDDGKARITIPPNPDDLLNGGTLQLTLTDGITSCGSMSIQVMPMTPASGDPLGDVVADLDQVINDFVTQFGLDANQLANTSLADLPPQAVPVALLLEARANFDAATQLSGLTSDQAAFLQALIAKFDTATLLENIHTSMSSLGAAKSGASPAASAAAGSPSTKADCGYLGTVPAGFFGLLPDAPALSSFIKAARGAADSIGPLSQNISDTGTAFAVMGLAVPEVGAIAGWLAYCMQLIQNMRANLYPSSISRLEYKITKTKIEEDIGTTNSDPQVRWNFAKLWATNNGMGLARVGIDLITTAAALPSGFGNATADLASGALDIAGKNALNNRLDQLNDQSNANECWSIGPTEFGPVTVDDNTGDTWVDGGVIAGEAVSMDPSDNRHIIPERIGTATIRVHTQPDPFPGPIGLQDQGVEVLRKVVTWLPSTLLVKNPGGPATVKFRIDNALHTEPQYVKVTPAPVLGTLPTPSYNNGVYTITFDTPSDKKSYPTWIEAESTSGEEPPATPPRSGRVEILLDKDVTIAPRDTCVSSGKNVTFTATVSPTGISTVNWEIESGAGKLSATSGESVSYTAPPSGSGSVTLHAYLADDTTIEDRVTFRYGKCSGLAAYYAHSVAISFPFGSGGLCNNPDLNDQYQVDTLPDGGAQALVPPDPADLWAGRTEYYSHRLQDSGSFGTKLQSTDPCTYADFFADAGFTSTLTGSDDGTRLDFDVATDASSNGIDLGQLGIVNSMANAAVSVVARFDVDLPQAADYRLQVNLTGSIYNPPSFPTSAGALTVIIVQVEPDGTPVPTNASTQPINTTYSNDNPTINIDRVISFTQPTQPDQVDHGMVVMTVTNTSFGAMPQETGDISHTGTLNGYISLTPQ